MPSFFTPRGGIAQLLKYPGVPVFETSTSRGQDSAAVFSGRAHPARGLLSWPRCQVLESTAGLVKIWVKGIWRNAESH